MKQRKIFSVLIICALMISLTSCQKDELEKFSLIVQHHQASCYNARLFIFDKDSVMIFVCSTDRKNPEFPSIDKYIGTQKLNSKQIKEINKHLENAKGLEGENFLSSNLKGGGGVILDYGGRLFTSDFRAYDVKWRKEHDPERKGKYPNDIIFALESIEYEEGYSVLNEFAEYIYALYPEVFEDELDSTISLEYLSEE